MGRPLAALLLVVASACGGSTACPGFCEGYPGPEPATLSFQCSLDVAPTVVSTGPCTAQVLNGGVQNRGSAGISVEPTAPGSCQVDVTLADGYRSTTNVTFVASYFAGDSCCRSGTAIAPTVSGFVIDNPADACAQSQAGADASLIGGDGSVRGGDASAE